MQDAEAIVHVYIMDEAIISAFGMPLNKTPGKSRFEAQYKGW